jgi:hypothetical protein
MNYENNEQMRNENEQANTHNETNKYHVGVVNNPCGSGKCIDQNIDPEHFLSESCASVCWDCWFVSSKIQL